MKKRILCILLCCCLVISLLPMSVFAADPQAVSIGGVTVDSADWYAKTDPSGTVTTAGASASDWNIHVVTGDVGGTPTATVTLKDATIVNLPYSTPIDSAAIGATGYDLRIVLEGTANQIGTVANSSYGNAVYSEAANTVTITGAGDLTMKGNYGINMYGSGAASVDTTGSLNIVSAQQTALTSGSLTVSAKSITTQGSYFGGSTVSLTATDGDISLTTKSSFNGAVRAYGSALLTADKGAVTIHHSDDAQGGYALNGKVVTVRALNDVAITTSRGAVAADGAVSVTSQSGSIQMDCAGDQCILAGGAVTLSAAKDVTLNDSASYSTAIMNPAGKTVAVTAGGKLASASAYGFQVGALSVKANEVSIAGNVQDGIQAGSVAITNPTGGNCMSVSITAASSYSDRAAISSSVVNIQADDVFICGQNSAKAIIANNTADNVTIGDAGLIIGAVSIGGANHISANIVQAGQSGPDASGGLNLSTGTPTQSTYYKAGNGYALFTPASIDGTTPAKLLLHNAEIHNSTNFPSGGAFGPKYDGIALPAENLTLQVEGTNKISSYDGNGISSGANLTLSGNGTLTVEKTKCGISLKNGSLAFAEGASVTLNSTVTTGDDSHMASAVYGNVTVESTDMFNKVRLLGDVTITKGATLTVPEGQTLWLNNATSVTNNGTIVNNGRILLPYSYTAAQVQALNLSGSIRLYDMDTNAYKVYVNGGIYADGGEISGDLDLSTPPAEITYYSSMIGYLLFTPGNGGTPATLTLHNVNDSLVLTLPGAPMTLNLEGANTIYEMEASNAVTVSGSGSMDAYLFRNSDASAALTVNTGAALNTLYQTTDANSVTTNTIYGSYTVDDIYGVSVNMNTKLALAPGAVLRLAEAGSLEFYSDAALTDMTIGAGASIVNNTFITLPKGTTAAQIAALPLSGTGVVRVTTTYNNNGYPETWDTYTNGGAALTVISGLNLTGGSSGTTLEHDGYTWNGGTLTLGNACIDGTLTLPSNAPVVINTTAGTVIRGAIMGDGNAPLQLTFTGTAPLAVSGGINCGINGTTVTVRDGAQVAVSGEISLGGSGTGGTLNVLGSGTRLSASTLQGPAVMCDTVNVQNGASLTAKSEGDGSIGVEALTGVNVTDGSTLTAGCDYGIYIIGGKLTVDGTSTLITNAAVAPFCIVDHSTTKAAGDVLSLANLPAGTQIARALGTDPEYGYAYWSLVPTDGRLGVFFENNTPVTLTGAKTGRLSFVKTSTPDGGNTGDNGNGSGNGNSTGFGSTGDNANANATTGSGNKNPSTGNTNDVIPAVVLTFVTASVGILTRRRKSRKA